MSSGDWFLRSRRGLAGKIYHSPGSPNKPTNVRFLDYVSSRARTPFNEPSRTQVRFFERRLFELFSSGCHSLHAALCIPKSTVPVSMRTSCLSLPETSLHPESHLSLLRRARNVRMLGLRPKWVPPGPVEHDPLVEASPSEAVTHPDPDFWPTDDGGIDFLSPGVVAADCQRQGGPVAAGLSPGRVGPHQIVGPPRVGAISGRRGRVYVGRSKRLRRAPPMKAKKTSGPSRASASRLRRRLAVSRSRNF